MEKEDISIRVLLLGDYDVGKSSIILQYTEQKFTESKPEIIDDLKSHYLFVDGKKVKLILRDTVGKERFRCISGASYKADAVLIVYDMTKRESFTSLQDWVSEVNQFCPENCQKLLISNKCDLKDDIAVNENEGRQYATNTLDVPFFLTSAKTGENLKAAFEKMVSMVLAVNADSLNTLRRKQPSTIELLPPAEKNATEDKCCG